MSFSWVRCVFWGTLVAATFTLVVIGDDLVPHKNPLRNGEEPVTGPLGNASPPTAIVARSAPVDTAHAGGSQFDPIKENGEYFVEKVDPGTARERKLPWPTPKLALVITGREDGYIEPCGCAGIEKMKGGLMRRGSFLDELRKVRQWPVVAVDVGSLIKGFGPQVELKFQTTFNALSQMGYAAIAPGSL